MGLKFEIEIDADPENELWIGYVDVYGTDGWPIRIGHVHVDAFEPEAEEILLDNITGVVRDYVRSVDLTEAIFDVSTS